MCSVDKKPKEIGNESAKRWQTAAMPTGGWLEGDKAENQAQLDKIKAVQVTHHGNRHGRRRAEKAARAVVESNDRGFREATVPKIDEGRMIIAKCDGDAEKGAPFMVGKLKEACSPGESTPDHRAHHATSDAHSRPAQQCTQTRCCCVLQTMKIRG